MSDLEVSTSATILIVDDEPLNCRLLEALLQPEGYRTSVASSGDMALESVADDPPDLILLDVMMPGMDGYQVASLLKAEPSTANIPIIMVSALGDRHARLRGLNAGAEDFLTKPVDKGELWLRVRNLLRLKDLSDRLQGQSAALEQQVLARTADLHQLAHYDALTCVPNRAFLYETLRKTLPVAAAKGWAVAVMFVDLDHFKNVNDTLGHAVGDALLMQFSGRLVESVRLRDTVGRLGGDEFAIIVLLEAGHHDAAAVVATKIRNAMQAPFDLPGHQTRVTASIGISLYPHDASDADALLQHADTAMYRAKEAGRNTFLFFTAKMNEQAAARHQVEAAARKDVESTGTLALSMLEDMSAPTCAVDEDGVITTVNRAWREVGPFAAPVPMDVGTGDSYVVALSAHQDGDSEAFNLGISSLLSGARDRFELDYSRSEGDVQHWFNLVAFPLPGGRGAVMSHLDVTVVRQAVAKLADQKTHDALTKLPNREHALELLGEILVDPLVEHTDLAAACIGIDGLKHINASFGYSAGDELLQAVSARLADHVRCSDTLARFSGDEFVVVWPHVTSRAEAAELAERLAAVFTTPFSLSVGSVVVSASIGAAVRNAGQSAEDLLLAASEAMRDAKRRGPGRTSVYTSELRQEAQSRVRVEAEIRAGIARQEFVLHYQPVVDLQNRSVTGVEALVRWNHPDGLRMPDTFIPIAEQAGLIVPLGAWILAEACRQSAAWSAEGLDLIMGVNLSVRQVADPGLISVVEGALKRAQMAPDRLLLEITESAVIEDADLALTALVRLKAMGASIAIDDFGTGYSSLLYLKRYPVHTLKIDRSFVSGMGIYADDDAIVASVIALARAVQAVCTAEGVETPEQSEALRALGCGTAQGYLYSPPVPAGGIREAITQCEEQLGSPLLLTRTGSRTRHVIAPSVVDRISVLYEQGSSLHTIAAALNSAGDTGPGGVRWSSQSVQRVLWAAATAANLVSMPGLRSRAKAI